jgi:hypothetical protein
MHPMCYYRIDNIEVGPQPVTEREIKAREILARVPTARHAELDQIVFENFRIRLGGGREVLIQRRASIARMLEARIRNYQESEINRARRAKFIGPLTIQMENGHPF